MTEQTVQTNMTLKDSYDTYCSLVSSPIKKQTYLFILYDFMKFIISLVFQGEKVVLPAGMGTLQVIGEKIIPEVDENGKIKGLAPDWGATRKLWQSNPQAKEQKKIIYHFNEHTNGIRYKIFWSKKHIKATHQSLYSLQFARDTRRASASNIFDGKEYIVKNEF